MALAPLALVALGRYEDALLRLLGRLGGGALIAILLQEVRINADLELAGEVAASARGWVARLPSCAPNEGPALARTDRAPGARAVLSTLLHITAE